MLKNTLKNLPNLIAISSPSGPYLTSLHFFHYIIEDSNGATKIRAVGANDGTHASEDLATLIPLGGLELVRLTQAGTGFKFAVNRMAVKRVKPTLSGKAEIIFFDESSITTEETYIALAPYFTAIGSAGGASVLTDGVTIVGNGDTVVLSVGEITGSNIALSSVTWANIQDINPNVLLGRYNPGTGVVQEITLGFGLEFVGSTLALIGTPVFDIVNIGAGVGLFDATVAGQAQFRSITGVGYITAALDVDEVEISTIAEINTASNIGGGAGVFLSKVGEDLQFRSLVAGAGSTVTQTGNTITIAASILGARNGLTLTDYVELGGTLIQATTIAGAGFNFRIQNAGIGEFAANSLILGSATSVGLSGATLSAIFTGAGLVQADVLTLTGSTSAVVNSPVVTLGTPTPVVSIGNLYSFASAAPSIPVDGDKQIMQWRNDAGTPVVEFIDTPVPGTGGGTTASWYDISPGGPFRRVQVRASGPGITFTQDSSNEWAFDIPDGVDLYSGSVFAETAANPGSNLYVKFTFNGNGPDGAARVANTSLDNLRPPQSRAINMSVEGFSGPTRLLPAAFNRLAGSSLLEENITAAPGIAGAGYLEIGYGNYSSNQAAGNGASMLIFNF